MASVKDMKVLLCAARGWIGVAPMSDHGKLKVDDLRSRIDEVLADPAANCVFGDGCVGAPPEAMCGPCRMSAIRVDLATKGIER